MSLEYFCQCAVSYGDEEGKYLKFNAINFIASAKLFSVTVHNEVGKGGEHQCVHYFVGPEPFPKCPDFRNIRPRHAAENHDDDTAEQAGVDMSCQTFQRLSDEGFVTFCVEEVVHLGCIGDFDFDDPAFAVWVAVDFLRSVGECLVEFDDFAANRHEHL